MDSSGTPVDIRPHIRARRWASDADRDPCFGRDAVRLLFDYAQMQAMAPDEVPMTLIDALIEVTRMLTHDYGLSGARLLAAVEHGMWKQG